MRIEVAVWRADIGKESLVVNGVDSFARRHHLWVDFGDEASVTVRIDGIEDLSLDDVNARKTTRFVRGIGIDLIVWNAPIADSYDLSLARFDESERGVFGARGDDERYIAVGASVFVEGYGQIGAR